MLTATDASGNTNTIMCSVTVVDEVDPVAACPTTAPIVMLDATGAGTLAADALAGGNSSDACGVTETSPMTTYSCSEVGTQMVMLTATDDNGNTNTIMCSVTVVDEVDPVALCKDITVYLDNSGMVSISEDSIDNGSNDACGILSFDSDVTAFDCGDLFVANSVTLTVTDNNNNVSQCSANVTVLDDLEPVFAICPADITVQTPNADACTGTYSTVANVFDNCTNKANLTLSTNAVLLGSGGSTTNTGDVTFVYDALNDEFNVEATFMRVGDNRVRLYAEDASGNVDSCEFIITVEDLFGPELIFCPSNQNIANPNNQCQVQVFFSQPVFDDPCGNFTLNMSHASGDFFDAATTTTVTWIATDGSGNSTVCSWDITVGGTCNPSVDMTSSFAPTSSSFMVNQQRDVVVNLQNIQTGASGGVTRIFIPSLPGYQLTFDTLQTTDNTLLGSVSVENEMFTSAYSGSVTVFGGGILLETLASVPASSFRRFAVKALALTPGASGTFTINIEPGSGGEPLSADGNNVRSRTIVTGF